MILFFVKWAILLVYKQDWVRLYELNRQHKGDAIASNKRLAAFWKKWLELTQLGNWIHADVAFIETDHAVKLNGKVITICQCRCIFKSTYKIHCKLFVRICKDYICVQEVCKEFLKEEEYDLEKHVYYLDGFITFYYNHPSPKQTPDCNTVP